MPKLTVSITGKDSLQNGLKGMREVMATILEDAAWAGSLEVMNAAQEKAPVKTGTLRRSIHPEVVEKTDKRVTVRVGPDVPYGARIEFGFVGTDSLGRKYNQGPRPYMRPAFEETKGQVIQTMKETLTETVVNEINSRSKYK